MKNEQWTSDEFAKKFHNMRLYKAAEIATAREFINKQHRRGELQTFLDYGCGNGAINTILPGDIEKTLYDINPDIVPIDDLKQHNCELVKDVKNLPKNYFDAALLSFVLLCQDNEDSFTEILENIKRAKKSDGNLIIVESHPDYLEQEFSWYSSTTLNGSFKDMKPGTPFTRHIHEPGNEISFTDHHYPLDFVMNKLSKVGMSVVGKKDIMDPGFGLRPKNEKCPALYSLICK